MNVYTYAFQAQCIKNAELIDYSLEIKTNAVIIVEELEAWPIPEKAFHEDLADALFERFGGRQTLTATHGKVEIVTTRRGLSRRPSWRE